MTGPDFWNDQDAAQAAITKKNGITAKLEPFLKLEERLSDLKAAMELAKEFDDLDSAKEAASEFKAIQ